MRFEIRAGGGFIILLGLLGLSGAVFVLGLVAGNYMARQNQPDINQISSTYPLPNPPEKPAPVSEMSPAAEASPAVASAPAPSSADETARACDRRSGCASRCEHVAGHRRASETACRAGG